MGGGAREMMVMIVVIIMQEESEREKGENLSLYFSSTQTHKSSESRSHSTSRLSAQCDVKMTTLHFSYFLLRLCCQGLQLLQRHLGI